MSNPTHPTFADDCERLLRILIDAPETGITVDEIQAKTEGTDDLWSLRTVNGVLTELVLHKRAAFTKGRERGVKVTRYHLPRSNGSR